MNLYAQIAHRDRVLILPQNLGIFLRCLVILEYHEQKSLLGPTLGKSRRADAGYCN